MSVGWIRACKRGEFDLDGAELNYETPRKRSIWVRHYWVVGGENAAQTCVVWAKVGVCKRRDLDLDTVRLCAIRDVRVGFGGMLSARTCLVRAGVSVWKRKVIDLDGAGVHCEAPRKHVSCGQRSVFASVETLTSTPRDSAQTRHVRVGFVIIAIPCANMSCLGRGVCTRRVLGLDDAEAHFKYLFKYVALEHGSAFLSMVCWGSLRKHVSLG